MSKETSNDYDSYYFTELPKGIRALAYSTKVNVTYEDNQKYINEFKSNHTLGTGAFSKVKHATKEYFDKKEEGKIVAEDFALKVMHKPTLNRERCASYTKTGELLMGNALEKVFTEIGKVTKIYFKALKNWITDLSYFLIIN